MSFYPLEVPSKVVMRRQDRAAVCEKFHAVVGIACFFEPFGVAMLPRREFLLQAGAVSTSLLAASTTKASDHPLSPDTMGVLVDFTACVGCRLCEYACKKANGIETGTLKSYDDQSVFRVYRRPSPAALTTINAFKDSSANPVYAKTNCVHCNDPACVSACIVGALTKEENGAVTYDAWKCIGCRYCMVACPMQLPAYEYDNVLTPKVQKCQLCHHRTIKGELPACVEECPRQVMIYGKRDELLALAHKRIAEAPDKYVDHIYGEHEVGGTSWLYLSPVPFEEVKFLKLGSVAPPRLTEAIQHGVFKHWIAPIGLYAFLSAMYWITGRRASAHTATLGDDRADDQEESNHPSPVPPSPPHTPAPAWEDRGSSSATATLIRTAPPSSATLPRAASASEVQAKPEAHHHHEPAAPWERKLLTPGVWVLIAMVITGAAFGLYRFIVGLQATTNLDQQHPWGLWIAMDVGSGIALAGGGFVTAALVHIFHREHYHAIARSALLTALLGYTFYVPGLLADLGRWYNLWHPTLPMMWQGNSVLFEVGMCVMIYLNVQYAELTPIICERVAKLTRFPRIATWAGKIERITNFVLPALLILGVTLSTFHQSSLGNLMVIAPYKLHPLWWSPISPIFFLVSAAMVGLPMVIFTMLFGSWSLRREPEMHVLAPLSRYIVVFLVLYLGTKIGDIIVRQTYYYLQSISVLSVAFTAELLIGVVLPLGMLLSSKVRQSPKWLGISSLLVILGVVLNRLNVFVIAYNPPYAEKTYFPSITEMAVSLGLVAALMLTWRVAVTYLPILQPARKVAS